VSETYTNLGIVSKVLSKGFKAVFLSILISLSFILANKGILLQIIPNKEGST